MKISDKAFGYISFAVILLIIVGVTIGMWQAHHESSTQAIIDFQELGSLSPEDPMTENGYEIGHVGDVEWLGNRSRVTVIFDEPITLHKGTRFRNASFALMGQRRIELIRSREGEVLPKDYVFQGEFVPGITESLRFITELHDQVMVTREAILTILSGNDTLPSVTQKYQDAMRIVEGLLDKIPGPIGIGQGMQGRTGKLGVGKCTKDFDVCIMGCPPEDTPDMATSYSILGMSVL